MKTEPKIYKIPENARWFNCKSCNKEITFIYNENMKNIPITKEGINHFIDCPARDKFRKKEPRTQTIILDNGMEVIINHSSKCKCSKCNKDIVYALIPLELVSLARWDIHKCKEKQ